jgi:hypothetical protein
MKKILLLTLAIALLATAAFAEKPATSKDAIADPASRIVLSGTLDANSPIWNRGFNNVDAPDPTCAYPLSDSSDGQSYDLFCITVTDENPIEIIVDAAATTLGDTHMELYCDPFDPNAPLDNAVFSDDDDGDGLYSAFTLSDNLVLTPGQDYWLVLTTFSAGDFGDFSITTSENVAVCGGVAAESHSFSDVKGLYR